MSVAPAASIVLRAGTGLAARPGAALTVEVDDDGVGALLNVVAPERLEGALAAALAEGSVAATPSARRRLHDAHHAAVRTSLAAEAAALRIASHASASGIELRALKGLAHAHLDERDPSWRTFGDADLLVRADDLDTFLRLLERLGMRRVEPTVSPRWERRFAKSVTVSDGDVEVDVHLRLSASRFGFVHDPAELWSSSEHLGLDGPLGALSAPWRLLHAAEHATLSRTVPLRALRDVALLASRHDVWSQTVAIAHRCALVAPLATAVTAAWQRLDLVSADPLEWASTVLPSRADQRALDAAARGYRAESRAAMGALGWSDRTAFVGGLVLRRLRGGR